MFAARGQQFHFTRLGHLWVHSTYDDVWPRCLCEALIVGEFFVNEHVTAEKNKECALSVDWLMSIEIHGDFLQPEAGYGG